MTCGGGAGAVLSPLHGQGGGRQPPPPETPQVGLLCVELGRADHHPLPWSEQEQRDEGWQEKSPWGDRIVGGMSWGCLPPPSSGAFVSSSPPSRWREGFEQQPAAFHEGGLVLGKALG